VRDVAHQTRELGFQNVFDEGLEAPVNDELWKVHAAGLFEPREGVGF
jgi:hypothetical protein